MAEAGIRRCRDPHRRESGRSLGVILAGFQRRGLWKEGLANPYLSIQGLESSLECIHKDHGQEAAIFLGEQRVPWLCQYRHHLQYGTLDSSTGGREPGLASSASSGWPKWPLLS